MAQAKKGDTVRVNYIGKLADGSVFDSTEDDEPIEFVIGGDEVLNEFEGAVIGMTPGDKKTVAIKAENAYGDYDEELIYEIGHDQLPEGLQPELGMDLQIRMPSGQGSIMTIVDIEDDAIVLDANHPLAGEDLVFEIELVEIVK